MPLVAPGDKYYAQRSQFDLGLAKSINFGPARKLRLQFDVFNLFNANTIMSEFQTYGPRLNQPQEVLVGRLMRIGAQRDGAQGRENNKSECEIYTAHMMMSL